MSRFLEKFVAMSLFLVLMLTSIKAVNLVNFDLFVETEVEAAMSSVSITDEIENDVVAVAEVPAITNIDRVSDLKFGAATIEFPEPETQVEEEEIVEPIPTVEVVEEPVNNQKTKYGLSEHEIYELAKIVMCEAEGESQTCKEYVAQVILNRIESRKFPNTVHGVIFDGHQFTPTFDGRWEKVEPNQNCYDAVYTVLNSSTPLTTALYFETCSGESWHSRNLTQVATISSTRFYIE